MPERFRGELLTMGRYTNPASFITQKTGWELNHELLITMFNALTITPRHTKNCVGYYISIN